MFFRELRIYETILDTVYYMKDVCELYPPSDKISIDCIIIQNDHKSSEIYFNLQVLHC